MAAMEPSKKLPRKISAWEEYVLPMALSMVEPKAAFTRLSASASIASCVHQAGVVAVLSIKHAELQSVTSDVCQEA